jgi:hypothetical protein
MVLAIPGGVDYSASSKKCWHIGAMATTDFVSVARSMMCCSICGGSPLILHDAPRGLRISSPPNKQPLWVPRMSGGKATGGVHFVPLSNVNVHPLLWSCSFHRHIQNKLITFKNPSGTITNSDLELTVSVARHNVLTQQADIQEATIHSSSDNVATIWWQSKLPTFTKSDTIHSDTADSAAESR